MAKGWRLESKRHGLASRGIKTAQRVCTIKPADKKSLKMLVSANINKAIQDQKGDVCQIGLQVAGFYGKSEEEYNLIWKQGQELFDQDTMESEPYILKESSKKKYIELYADAIVNKDYLNLDVEPDTGLSPGEIG